MFRPFLLSLLITLFSTVGGAENNVAILLHQAPTLNSHTINLALRAYENAKREGYSHSPILTIVDYTLPSNQKRLWVFNLNTQQLLFYTYVSQGIHTGIKWAHYFSNQPGSYDSSLGLYKTDNAYFGHWGYALRLKGLDRKFNDNAWKRNIVIHGGKYVSEKFIEHYGYAGNSHGCFVVSNTLIYPLINTIKNGSLLFVYYPNKEWLAYSKFV